jgi:hypothetical protein
MKEKKEKKDKTKQPEKTLKEIEFEKLSLFFDNYISNGKLITKYALFLASKE